MSKRRIQVIALSVLTVLGSAVVTSAAEQQQQRRRTIGANATVTQTRNGLTGSASITDSATNQPRRRTSSRRGDTTRVLAQRARVNRFVRDRVDSLRKLESYRNFRSN
jgi:hypothetical protein